jgi:hypothetical protein
VAHATLCRGPRGTDRLARVETDVLVALCRWPHAWQMWPTGRADRGGALESCKCLRRARHLEAKRGFMPSATGSSTALRCRETTGAQGDGDRAACLFDGRAWSGGEAAWHCRRDRRLVCAAERPVTPAIARRLQLQDSDHAEPAHAPLPKHGDAAEPNRPTSPASAGHAAGTGEATRNPCQVPMPWGAQALIRKRGLCTSTGEGRVCTKIWLDTTAHS